MRAFIQTAEMHLPAERIKTAPRDVMWEESFGNQQWWSRNNMDKDDVFLSSSGMANADSDHKAEALRELEDFRTLHSILIRIGGWETVFAHDEPDMKAILERGRYFPGKSLSISGRPSQCHDNVRSFYANPTKKTVGAKICTGYALSEDGFWRQHSWLYQPYTTSGGKETFRIIETTVKRLAYFGFIMTDAEAQKFINQ